MRRLAGLWVAVAVLALIAGCGQKDGSTGSGGDEEGEIGPAPALAGTYLIVGLEAGGKPFASEEDLAKGPEADRTFTITADKMIATANGKEDPVTYKVDTSKTPYEIDITAKKGGKDLKRYGIYKAAGDKIILCVVESDDPADRPKRFKTAEGGKALTMTLKKK